MDESAHPGRAHNSESVVSRELAPDILNLIRAAITSVWTLEVLLLVSGTPRQEWEEAELVRELRASPMIVREGLASLIAVGAVARDGRGRLAYAASGDLDGAVRQLADAFQDRPMTVIKAISEAPDERIRTFADAFRLKR